MLTVGIMTDQGTVVAVTHTIEHRPGTDSRSRAETDNHESESRVPEYPRPSLVGLQDNLDTSLPRSSVMGPLQTYQPQHVPAHVPDHYKVLKPCISSDISLLFWP